MNIWVVKIGEPLPLDSNCQERLHRVGILSRMLVERGHTVTWWTSTFDRVTRKNLFAKDTVVTPMKGLRIFLLHSQGYRRSISLSRFMDHRTVAASFAKLARQEAQPDIILCAFPTIELSRASVEFGREFGVPVILDIRDMWPDILADSVPKLLKPLAHLFLKKMFIDANFACRHATSIIGITDEFVAWALKKAGIDKRKNDRSFPMAYTLKRPKDKELQDAEEFWDKLGVVAGSQCFNICFIGTLGHQFHIDTVIESARMLSKTGGTSAFRFIICGAGDMLPSYRKMVQDDTVIFPGWVNEAQMYVLMMRSHVGLNPIPDRYDFLATINNKSIEYLSAGLPILSSPQRGVLHQLVQSHRCGQGYDPTDAQDLCRKLQLLAANPEELVEMSGNALRLYNDRFVAEKVYGQLMLFMEDLAGTAA